MATATRIYYVNAEGVERLVRATHPNAALMHVARGYTVRVANQDDLVNCLIEGIRPESAKEEAEAPKEEAAPPAAEQGASQPLWPMPTPVASGFTDMPTPRQEDDDEDEDGEGDTPAAGLSTNRQRQPAKYRDAHTGSTWSGRGIKPTWLRVALANGHELAEFEVVAATAQA